jgi:hypothetical protein
MVDMHPGNLAETIQSLGKVLTQKYKENEIEKEK